MADNAPPPPFFFVYYFLVVFFAVDRARNSAAVGLLSRNNQARNSDKKPTRMAQRSRCSGPISVGFMRCQPGFPCTQLTFVDMGGEGSAALLRVSLGNGAGERHVTMASLSIDDD